MARPKTFSGTTRTADPFGCEPLHSIVGPELCAQFMCMFDVDLSNGHTVRAFKHSWTRAYLHLDCTEVGLAYVHTDHGRYRPIDLRVALVDVFCLWRADRDDECTRDQLLLNLALARIERCTSTRAVSLAPWT